MLLFHSALPMIGLGSDKKLVIQLILNVNYPHLGAGASRSEQAGHLLRVWRLWFQGESLFDICTIFLAGNLKVN